MNMKTYMLQKLASRKFILALAAFLAIFFTGVAGVISPDICAIGMALSAALYGACEAYVDGQSAKSNTTQTTTTIQALSNDRAVVAKILTPDSEE